MSSTNVFLSFLLFSFGTGGRPLVGVGVERGTLGIVASHLELSVNEVWRLI